MFSVVDIEKSRSAIISAVVSERECLTLKARIGLVWENFGPTHMDRCEALSRSLGEEYEVMGIELASESVHYDWRASESEEFKKVTLFRNTDISKIKFLRRAYRLTKALIRLRLHTILFCHYEHPSTFIAAVVLRILGRKVFVMNDSKFDDYDRHLGREMLKYIAYLPYQGAIVASKRSESYLRFLGFRRRKIELYYDTISVERLKSYSVGGGISFEDRYLIIIARFVPKKNLISALCAFAILVQKHGLRRRLRIYGSGPMEQLLRSKVDELGLNDLVTFVGAVQTDEIGRALTHALALLLPSKEEQFGFVIIEALTLGIPVVISENCGARDLYVRTGVNGFIVEPDNHEGVAYFLSLLCSDESLWDRMSCSATSFSIDADASRFALSVGSLIECKDR